MIEKALAYYILANVISYSFHLLNSYFGEVKKPVDKVSIVICGWDERDGTIERCLESVKNQNVIKEYPEYFEIIYVAGKGINLEIVRKYVDKLIYYPIRGKLNARHIGILSAKGNIIVSLDSDIYLPRNFINELIKPFYDKEVVATLSNTQDFGILELFVSIPSVIWYNLIISARASAFRKEIYLKEPFNLKINQIDIDELWKEEEWNFKKKLEKYGKIVYVPIKCIHLGYEEGRGLRSYIF